MATLEENPLVEGLERLPVHPTNMVIFGATGDLAKRKLLPAIYNLAHEGALPERFNLDLLSISSSITPCVQRDSPSPSAASAPASTTLLLCTIAATVAHCTQPTLSAPHRRPTPRPRRARTSSCRPRVCAAVANNARRKLSASVRAHPPSSPSRPLRRVESSATGA